ncbi:hypothetical protein M427DRAFT_30893 [Gonapodya prolifera JEL478]|uniref:Calponin-homology (CH) domain-containing protein n=1 Tax=Gonapodya prolifera (strain JEL478) TaxID=1344416 RepID=A0A139AJ53_GONPJ|nr:hypothetical protein M427DRAFT_30893 [Gonapodya prolifera JEL478]|eukprot:KXS16769.1 hypothetical protein M427DRAFT_30893 [Gonapodya prolifera JEL478]
MSHTLAQWINGDVHLSASPITSDQLDAAFANGYLFAEILSRHGVGGDLLGEVANSSKPEVAIRNFTLLERILRERLGVKISSTFAFDIIHCKPGNAAKLLYQVKSALGRLAAQARTMEEPIEVSNIGKWDVPTDTYTASEIGHSEGRLDAAAPAKVDDEFIRPDSPAGGMSSHEHSMSSHRNERVPVFGSPPPLPPPTFPHPVQAAFLEREHAFFAERLKAKLRRTEEAQFAMVKEKEKTEKMKATMKQPLKSSSDPTAKSHEQVSRNSVQPRLKGHASSSSTTQHTSDQTKPARKAAPYQRPPKNIVDFAAEQKAVKEAALLMKQAKEKAAEDSKKRRIAETFQSAVSAFERSLEGSSLSSSTSPVNNLESATVAPATASSSSIDLTPIGPGTSSLQEGHARAKQMQRKLLSEGSNKEGKEIVEKLRVKKVEEEANRREREQVRRKELLTQQREQERLDAETFESLLVAKLTKVSKQERRIAQQLVQDYQEALSRERSLSQQIQETRERNAAAIAQQHQEVVDKKQNAKRKRHAKVCREVTEQILDLALKMFEQRSLADGFIPSKLMREWKTLFIAGKSLQTYREIDLPQDRVGWETPVAIPNEVVSPDLTPSLIPESSQILDDSELNDYLSETGHWPPLAPRTGSPPQNVVSNNEILGRIVKHIFDIIAEPELEAHEPLIPAAPLKIAVVGKPFSGVDQVALKLADDYGLKLLMLDEIIKDAVNSVTKDLDTVKQKGGSKANSSKDRKDRLGTASKLQMALLEGRSPDDALLVSLVVEYVNQISAPADGSPPGGWILSDFPRNRNQAQLLEKELSGYEDPKPVKPGNLKRSKDKRPNDGKDNEGKAPKPKSLLAQTTGESSQNDEPRPTSALDAVILLDVDNDTAFNRAAGQLIDPETKTVYHLDYNPPPTEVPGLLEKLVPVDDTDQLHVKIAAYEEQEELLRDWYFRFRNLQLIDAKSTPETVLNSVRRAIREVVQEKNRRLEEESRSQDKGDVLKEAEQHDVKSPTSDQNPKEEGEDQSSKLADAGEVPAPDRPMGDLNPSPLDRNIASDGLKLPTRSLAEVLADDRKQELVEMFQREYNEVEDDLRADPDAKAELHIRADDLRDRLWEMTDLRREEAEAERVAIISDKWIEDHYVIAIGVFIGMMQMEVDRFIGTKQLAIDYFKDAYSTVNNAGVSKILEETVLAPVKLPLQPASGAVPLDIAAILAPAKSAKVPAKEGSAGKRGQKEKHPIVPTPSLPNVEDDFSCPEIEAAYQVGFNAVHLKLSPKDAPAAEPEKKDNKKKADKTETVQETKPDIDLDLPPEYAKLIEFEEQLLRRRLERIRACALEHLKDLKVRGVEAFTLLDEWLNGRYQSELEAIKELVGTIKEAIEFETRLPNELVLEGDKFKIDPGVLTFEPEPERRPSTPVEKTGWSDAISSERILQGIAASGFIGVSHLQTLVSKLTAALSSVDPVPEGWMGGEPRQLDKMISILDPFETGSISSLDYFTVPLWFEDVLSEVDGEEPKYNRPAKIKEAISFIFAERHDTPMSADATGTVTESRVAVSNPDDTTKSADRIMQVGTEQRSIKIHDPPPKEESSVEILQFMLCCCRDENVKTGVAKAFAIAGNDSGLTLGELYTILHNSVEIVGETHLRWTEEPDAVDPFSKEVLAKLFSISEQGSPPLETESKHDDGDVTGDKHVLDRIDLETFIARSEEMGLTFQPLFQLLE